MKRFFLLLFCIIVNLHCFSKDLYLVIESIDGSTINIPLSEMPTTNVVDGQLYVTTDKLNYQFVVGQVRKYVYVSAENIPTQIDQVEVAQSGNLINLAQLKAKDKVQVFNLSGVLLETATIGSDGTCSVNISTTQDKVMILKINDNSLKIMKR